MAQVQSGSSSVLEWAVASEAFPGESESGDIYLVHPYDGGVLVAVVDGVGHGHDAAAVSHLARETIAHCTSHSVITIVRCVHEALSGSRGAVMSVASFDEKDGTMTWLGIGNVEGTLMRSDQAALPRNEAILTRGGVVGVNLPQLRASVTTVFNGDTLFLATDGVKPGFASRLDARQSPERLASQVVSENFRSTDDALILVGRYTGPSGKTE